MIEVPRRHDPAAVRSAKVTVRPSGISFDAGSDESVMAAAERAGLAWPTTCHGVGDCRACVMAVLGDDLSALDEPGPVERAALDAISTSLSGDLRHWRLACQARIVGDIEVRKVGVRPG